MVAGSKSEDFCKAYKIITSDIRINNLFESLLICIEVWAGCQKVFQHIFYFKMMIEAINCTIPCIFITPFFKTIPLFQGVFRLICTLGYDLEGTL